MWFDLSPSKQADGQLTADAGQHHLLRRAMVKRRYSNGCTVTAPAANFREARLCACPAS
jgi:hypothetical protein